MDTGYWIYDRRCPSNWKLLLLNLLKCGIYFGEAEGQRENEIGKV